MKENEAGLLKVALSEESKPKENPGDVIGALQAAYQGQTRLIILADKKANALVGVMTVAFTIMFSKIQYLATFPFAGQIALLCFLLLEVAGVVFAMLVIFPRNVAGKGCEKPEDMSNPLFFGVYTQIQEEDYVAYMMQKFASGTTARKMLIADYYQVGVVLKRKYLLLRRAYLLAAGGFALMVIGLAIGLLKSIVSGG